MNSLPKRRLGRGLAALIGDDTGDEPALADTRNLRQIPIEFVHPNPNNPRHYFDDEAIEELAISIRAKGLLQPLMVRQREAGHFEGVIHAALPGAGVGVARVDDDGADLIGRSAPAIDEHRRGTNEVLGINAGGDSRSVRHDEREIFFRRVSLDAAVQRGKAKAARDGDGHDSRFDEKRWLTKKR